MHLRVNAGDYHNDDIPGIPHLAEHIVSLQGRGQCFSHVQRHGGTLQAVALYEKTTFSFSVAHERLTTSAKLLGACISQIVCAPELVHQEIRAIQRESTFYPEAARLTKKICRLGLEADHPLATDGMGSKRTLGVKDIRQRLRHFLDLYYHAANMTLVISSRDSVDQLQQLVECSFKYIPYSRPDPVSSRGSPKHSAWMAGNYIKVYGCSGKVLLFRWLNGLQLDPVRLPMLKAVLSLMKMYLELPHRFTMHIDPFGKVIIFLKVVVEKQSPEYIVRTMVSLRTALVRTMKLEDQNRLPLGPVEFDQAAADLLGQLDDVDTGLDEIPYVAKYGPCIDKNSVSQIRMLLKTMIATIPLPIIMSPTLPPPSSTQLMSIPGSTSVYEVLNWEQTEASSKDPSRILQDPAPKVLAGIKFTFILPPQRTLASKLTHLGLFWKTMADRHDMKTRQGLQDGSFQMIIKGTTSSNWEAMVSDILTFFQGDDTFSNMMDKETIRINSKAQMIIRNNLKEHCISDIIQAYLVDIWSLNGQGFTLMLDPNSQDMTMADIRSFALGLLEICTVKLVAVGLPTSSALERLVKGISAVSKTATFQKQGEFSYQSMLLHNRSSPINQSALPPKDLYYIPPPVDMEDAAIGVFFQSPVNNFATLLLSTICQAVVMGHLRWSLQLSYTPSTRFDLSIPGIRIAVQGKKSPERLMEALSDALRGLPDTILEYSLSDLGTLCVSKGGQAQTEDSLLNLRKDISSMAKRMFDPESKERTAVWVQFWPTRLAKEREQYIAVQTSRGRNIKMSLDQL